MPIIVSFFLFLHIGSPFLSNDGMIYLESGLNLCAFKLPDSEINRSTLNKIIVTPPELDPIW